MYQKSWWYDPQFLRYRAWGTEIGKFGSCFVLLPKILAPKITIIWCRFPRYEVRQTEFFAILGHFFFLPFYSPQQTRKSKFWKNKKKTPGDVIILHLCPKNHDHIMLPEMWSMTVRIFCQDHFWAIFCPFTSLTT